MIVHCSVTISNAYQNLKTRLSKIYEQREAANISHLVLEKLTGLNKIDRLINKNQILNVNQLRLFEKFSAELFNFIPVQYVLNEAWFAGLKFFVDERVLIPRPETEELVEWVTEDSKAKKLNLTILDIGTGSGCIAIALKKKFPFSTVFAIDISEKALKVATKNAEQNQVNVEFKHYNILSKNNGFSKFDIIISNPPYIPVNQIKLMEKNMAFEPKNALFVPDENPLLFYRSISEFSIHHFKENGNLFFEIHEDYGRDVFNLLKEKNFNSIQIRKDLQGKNRMIKASFNG